MDRDTLIITPSPRILENMLEIVAEPGRARVAGRGLRACAWHSLLRQRARHGSIAAARAAARSIEAERRAARA